MINEDYINSVLSLSNLCKTHIEKIAEQEKDLNVFTNCFETY